MDTLDLIVVIYDQGELNLRPGSIHVGLYSVCGTYNVFTSSKSHHDAGQAQ